LAAGELDRDHPLRWRRRFVTTLPWTVVIFSNAHASILKRLRSAHARAWAFSRRDLDPTLILADVEFGDANGIAVLDLDPAKVA